MPWETQSAPGEPHIFVFFFQYQSPSLVLEAVSSITCPAPHTHQDIRRRSRFHQASVLYGDTFIGRPSRPCRKMDSPLHALAVKDRGRSRRGRGKRREVREGAICQGREDGVEAKECVGPLAEKPEAHEASRVGISARKTSRGKS